MHRCFRAGVENYRSLCGALDAALGLPQNATTLTPAATAPRDSGGAVLVAIADGLHQTAAVSDVLDEFVSDGRLTEITESEYRQSVVYQVPE